MNKSPGKNNRKMNDYHPMTAFNPQWYNAKKETRYVTASRLRQKGDFEKHQNGNQSRQITQASHCYRPFHCR